MQRPVQGGLQPFARSDLALIAEPVMIGPLTTLHKKPHGFLNLPLVGITLCNYGHGHAVRAEDNLGPARHWKSRQRFFNFFDHCVQISGMLEEGAYAIYGNVIAEKSLPFVQAAARGG